MGCFWPEIFCSFCSITRNFWLYFNEEHYLVTDKNRKIKNLLINSFRNRFQIMRGYNYVNRVTKIDPIDHVIYRLIVINWCCLKRWPNWINIVVLSSHVFFCENVRSSYKFNACSDLVFECKIEKMMQICWTVLKISHNIIYDGLFVRKNIKNWLLGTFEMYSTRQDLSCPVIHNWNTDQGLNSMPNLHYTNFSILHQLLLVLRDQSMSENK